MYDPFAPPQLPQQVQGQTVGMVPGVPGSVGLNPGMGGPIQGQQQPGGPVMTPGGGGTGFPMHANNALGGVMQSPQFQAVLNSSQGQAFLQAYPQFGRYFSPGGMSPMADWRGARPDRQTYTGTDWRGAMQDWRQQRPGMAATPDMPPPQPLPAVTPGASADALAAHPLAGPPAMAPRPRPNTRANGTLSSPRGGAGSGYGF